MAITTIYKCDRCGKEQPDSRQFWTVGIVANTPELNFREHPKKSIQVCRPCLNQMGVFIGPTKDVPEPKVPTIEDLVREIIALAAVEP